MKSSDLFTGERFIPGIDDVKLQAEHYQRYISVRNLIKDKVVLDAACGEGYGSSILAESAKEVTGIDIDASTVKRAQQIYGGRENLHYMQGSIEKLEIEDHSIDAVISFETIEHVDEKTQTAFLAEIHRVLKKNGILVMSTPNKKIYSDLHNYSNEYHIKEFYHDEFIKFLSQHFQYVELFNQFFQVISTIEREKPFENNVEYIRDSMESYQDGKYYIAIASNEKYLNADISSVYVYDHGEYERNIERILTLQREEEARNRHIQKLDKEIKNLNNEINDLNNEINDLNNEINDLNKNIQLLKKRTLKYKLKKCLDILLPSDSRRRFFLRVVRDIITHPKLMFRVLNLSRVRNYLYYVKKEGMEGVKKRYMNTLEIESTHTNGGERYKVDLVEGTGTRRSCIDDFEKLEFSYESSPEVSIIIPVYNEFDYTYNCVRSIKRNSGDIAYEIIIANDCSVDFTEQVEKIADNVRLITTKENVGFLRNCNHAANFARGKYILFLNNDTQVQRNWLEALLTLIEKDETVGMVGSRLIYPDGFLQEAGGIVWKDASAWNYGNRKSPEASEYNYVKEVDYISGASIMIRRELWEKIGGFDDQFAPAYYEDTDLAFEVRKRGYKVMYQPLSVVVHFEGISNGTDVEDGMKQYQKINYQKFYDKWKDVLEAKHEENGVNVFLSRDRSIQKKHILVVDHYVPHHDRDAGGKCTYMYLKLFVKLGFQVVFIGDNFYRDEPYTTELQQLGIEVLYGGYYNDNWKKWLEENGKFFDYVYLQRPHISIKYIDLVKEYTDAKILYFAHDLHHVREFREYEITKDKEKLESSQHWKKIEYELFGKADVGHVVGSYEQNVMQKAFPNKPIRNIPLYIYEQMLTDIDKNFSKRKDLVYVGGFGHPPNIDAVLWFAKEVFPVILEKYPDIKWHVVGGSVPKQIEELASEHIIIEGFISDDALEQLYRKCRLAVVPLRFGAGVKGKVVEAAYFQIPLITTSIGAEGLSREEGFMVVEDDCAVMAESICELYEDFEKLRQMSDNGKVFINKYFMLSEAERMIRLDVDA